VKSIADLHRAIASGATIVGVTIASPGESSIDLDLNGDRVTWRAVPFEVARRAIAVIAEQHGLD
jgi:hypothetical protein